MEEPVHERRRDTKIAQPRRALVGCTPPRKHDDDDDDDDGHGMELCTLDDKPFLAVNDIQTLCPGAIDLTAEMAEMALVDVTHFQVLRHLCDIIAVDQPLSRRGGIGLARASSLPKKKRVDIGLGPAKD